MPANYVSTKVFPNGKVRQQIDQIRPVCSPSPSSLFPQLSFHSLTPDLYMVNPSSSPHDSGARGIHECLFNSTSLLTRAQRFSLREGWNLILPRQKCGTSCSRRRLHATHRNTFRLSFCLALHQYRPCNESRRKMGDCLKFTNDEIARSRRYYSSLLASGQCRNGRSCDVALPLLHLRCLRMS